MRVLFLVPYPTEGASNRVRVEQFIPYLNAKGVKTRVRPFVNKRFYRILYKKRSYIGKLFWFIVCTINRNLDLLRAVGYDIIFIHREAYPFGAPFIESVLHAMGKTLVFDFDDAIFLPNTSKENKYIDRFKNPEKIARIIAMSALVIAGNDYLRSYGAHYNKNVIVIPSSLDTERYKPSPRKSACRGITIGWIGSVTTKDFLWDIEGALADLSGRYKDLTIKVIGAEFFSRRLDNVVNKQWVLAEEVSDIQSFDIGIMPVPDNEWARGKCGFKAILYMACGIPVVASPVGVSAEIVDDGVTGFFARTGEEWKEKLSALIEDGELRRSMGGKGREKAVRKYSIACAAPYLYESLAKAYHETKK